MNAVIQKLFSSLLLLSNLAVAAETPMLVNAGAGGGWYEPATSGQGLVFDIIPGNNQLVAYWFTYPENGGAREWFVGQGDISGNRADLVVYRTVNGRFDQPGDVEVTAVGSASLEYASCQEANWDYSFDATGLSGHIDLVRLGPAEFCEQFLAAANLNAVSHRNSWVDIGGTWTFDGCVQLDASSSHGEENIVFTATGVTLVIDNYQTPNCLGPVSVQTLDFDLQRVDKTLALLEGEEVIANRYLLTDPVSGQTVRQLWYVDDRGEVMRITHGRMGSPADEDGYPTELHSAFAERD